jgi:hypothetical protein
MQRRAQRLSVTAVLVVALGALIAAPAQAATAVTQGATQVTAVGAVLNGGIETGGVATVWAFQYGTSRLYDHETKPQTIPAGQSVVFVHASITGLKSYTSYHFRLVAQVIGVLKKGAYYYTYPVYNPGADVQFKTRRIGHLTLQRGTLKIVRHKTMVTEHCNSTIACRGKLSLSIKAKVNGRHSTISCASARFSTGAGHKSSIALKISGRCAALLKLAPHTTLPGKLSAKVSSGQPNTGNNVSVKFKS